MSERNPNAYRTRGSCQFLCQGDKNQWKQDGKRTLAVNQNKQIWNRAKSNSVRKARGSNSS
eukprot:5287573-Heterocapsa_arctica.AAC.1